MTAGDQRVLAEAPLGRQVDLGDLPQQERVVSANVIRRLCVEAEARDIDRRGVWIRNARIRDQLDLSFCTVAHPLRFESVTFEAIPDFTGADLPALWIVDCELPGLLGNQIRTRELRLDSSLTGEVRLFGAEIGRLDCSGATLISEGVLALVADTAEIGNVVLGDGFSATGEVRLVGARIGGDLNCLGATLTNEDGIALVADTAEINGNVFFCGGFSATGALRLLGATIAGQLDCSGATLTNEGGDALDATTAEINGNVFLREGFSATGAVSLVGAMIAGQLHCSGATLTNEDGYALVADLAEIGNVVLGDGFSATGAVRLVGAKIGSNLDCSGATLTNEGGDALDATTAEINGNVFLREGFSATGALRLAGAKIGGQFICFDATLVNGVATALDCRHTTVGGSFVFIDVETTGGVNLFRASATTLGDDLGREDDPLGSWRAVSPLILDGFVYARFGQETAWDSGLRKQWLEHTTGFQYGAWRQLVAVYRSVGRDDEATRASIAMQNDRVRRAGLPWYRVAGRRLLGAVVGHGYRPWRAGVWAAAIIALFAFAVWHWPGMFVPDPGVHGSPQPVAYATDTFLPIVDLGQRNWHPTGWMRWIEWTVILLGWALTTIFVAGFTRIVRSE